MKIVTNAFGTVVKRIDYDSFGNILSDSNPTFSVPFGFAGGMHDRDTGLVRFGARDYDPATGKWTAKDPIDFAGGDLNLGLYASQNPINFIDPTGFYDYWDLGEDILGFFAGLGNAVSFGGTTLLAEKLLDQDDAKLLKQTKACSKAFKAGEWASLAIGAGRLAYAGLAKGGSLVYAARGANMANAAAASAFRNSLKGLFRLNPWTKFRIYPFEKLALRYGNSASAIISAAGRTNKLFNIVGAWTASGGATTLFIYDY